VITQNMTPLDIVEKYPETEKVFHEYDIILEKCLLCNNLFDTIKDIAAEHNLNINEMIEKLNNVLKME
jgi:iron-sulfur cluster repair protein YtfE (RIC family)